MELIFLWQKIMLFTKENKQNELRLLKLSKELEEEMKRIGEESEGENDKNDDHKDDLKPVGLKGQKLHAEEHISKFNQKRQVLQKRINIEKKRTKSFKQSSDNSATARNVSPNGGMKKNDAATNTHDYSFTQDMISFQYGNHSPTFE